jgi:CRISPR system Cascade subunit CasE
MSHPSTADPPAHDANGVGDIVTGGLWLSQVQFDPCHRPTRVALGDARARQRIVLDAFPGVTSRREAGVLYLYAPATSGQPPRLLVQSTTEPDWSFLPTYRGRSVARVEDISPFWDQVVAGARYRFRLTASPSRAVGGRDGNRSRGSRTLIRDPTAQIEWLTRVLHGAAELTHVQVAAPATTTSRRGERTLTLTSVTFSGALAVTDSDRLRQQAIAGIGPGKAYGNGLLAMGCEPRRQRPPMLAGDDVTALVRTASDRGAVPHTPQ